MPDNTGASRAALSALNSFVARHGKPVQAAIEHLGRAGARLVLIGPNGALGDMLVQDVAIARALCASVSGVEVASWDVPTVAKIRISAQFRRKMAGPRARRG